MYDIEIIVRILSVKELNTTRPIYYYKKTRDYLIICHTIDINVR